MARTHHTPPNKKFRRNGRTLARQNGKFQFNQYPTQYQARRAYIASQNAPERDEAADETFIPDEPSHIERTYASLDAMSRFAESEF